MTQMTAQRGFSQIARRMTAGRSAVIRAFGSAVIRVQSSGNPRHGQSTLEYLLVLAAILVLIISLALTSLQPGVQAMMSDSAATIQAATARVRTALGLPPPAAPPGGAPAPSAGTGGGGTSGTPSGGGAPAGGPVVRLPDSEGGNR